MSLGVAIGHGRRGNGAIGAYLATVGVSVALRRVVTTGIIVDAHSQFTLLHRGIEATTITTVVGTARESGVIALGTLTLGDNVKDAAHALGIVFRARVGYHLYFLDARRRHTLEHLLGVLGHHVVGLAVHIDFERAVAVDPYVVLPVYGHHGHLLEHLYHCVGVGLGVVLHAVGYLVYVGLDQRLVGHHLDRLQLVAAVLQEQRAQVYGACGGVYGVGALHWLAPHRPYHEQIAARAA